MTELFESNADVCLISAATVNSGNLSEVLLPVLCSQANTGGGSIIIGAERMTDDSVVIEGLSSIPKIQLLIDELVSDKSKISVNTIKTIRKIKEHGKDLIKIEVAPAPWTTKPVYINNDPVRGVYSYSEGQRAVSEKDIITLMAQDSLGSQNDNERLNYISEFFVDYNALQRYKESHRAKHPFPKWDLLDNESYMERIGAKSDGHLLKAGALMFGADENVSFCLRRINNGEESKIETENIWSFIELLLPIFESCTDIECKDALLEAFFNSLIHADYNFGRIEAIEEDDKFVFINSGIPRSRDNSSVCRNFRIMKMLCFVGYAKNKGSGMEIIKEYSKEIKLSVNYEKWQTAVSIPVPIKALTKPQAVESEKLEPEIIEPEYIEPEKSIISSVFYPVAKLAKLAKEKEQENISRVSSSEDIIDYRDTLSPYEIETGAENIIQIDVDIDTEDTSARVEVAGETESLKSAEEIILDDAVTTFTELAATMKTAALETPEGIVTDESALYETEATEEIIVIETTDEIIQDEVAAETAGIEETKALVAVEEIIQDETVTGLYDAEETEEIIVVEATDEIIQDEVAAETAGIEETKALVAVEEIIQDETVTGLYETEETEEIIVVEATDEIIQDEVSAETAGTEETKALVAVEEIIQDETVTGLYETEETEETEEIVYFKDNFPAEQQEESWAHLQDPEHRKILEQIIKDYLESSQRDEEKSGVTDREIKLDDKAKDAQDFLTDNEIKINYGEIKSKIDDDYSGAVKIVRDNMYASPDMIKDALFEYCREGFRTIGEISRALLRPESSVKRGINRMMKEGTLIENENNAYRSVPGIIGDV